VMCQAFPVGILLGPEHQEDADAYMKARLNATTFNGEMLELYRNFVQKLQEKTV